MNDLTNEQTYLSELFNFISEKVLNDETVNYIQDRDKGLIINFKEVKLVMSCGKLNDTIYSDKSCTIKKIQSSGSGI